MEPLDQINNLIRARAPFERIEAWIETTGLPANVRSALWLYAWAETDHCDRKRAVQEIITASLLADSPARRSPP